ncbi:MAG: erythromycin esterase family protein [Bacteroidales bacterium]
MKKSGILLLLLSMVIASNCLSRGDDERSFKKLIANCAIPLENSGSLDPLIEMSSGRKLVLLGEATHGTREFYAWRDSITRRLISETGFNFILVEGDWASLFLLNRYVKGHSDFSTATEVVQQFNRWPSWLWRNQEVVALAEWLRDFNQQRPPERKVGFYGMDVYDEWSSFDELMTSLEAYDANLAGKVSEYYNCMKAFEHDSWHYAMSVSRGYNACAPFLKAAFDFLEGNLQTDDQMSAYDKLYLVQNARVFKNAEKFYRKAVSDQGASWNSRVMHMFVTLQAMLDFYGPEAKAIVWAHNTHIGDARATDMAAQGQINIGQLAREHFNAEKVLLLGFGAYKGQVMAGRQWGHEMTECIMPEAMPGSFEDLLVRMLGGDFLLMMNPKLKKHPFMRNKIGHRAVGVVYNPDHERYGNYVPTIPGERYDAFIFFENTAPLNFVE